MNLQSIFAGLNRKRIITLLLVGVSVVTLSIAGFVIANPNFSMENRTEARVPREEIEGVKAVSSKSSGNSATKPNTTSAESAAAAQDRRVEKREALLAGETPTKGTIKKGGKKCSDSAGNQINGGTAVVGASDKLYSCNENTGGWVPCPSCSITDPNTMLPESYKGTVTDPKTGKAVVVSGKAKCTSGSDIYQSGDVVGDQLCGKDGKFVKITPTPTPLPIKCNGQGDLCKGIWNEKACTCDGKKIPTETPTPPAGYAVPGLTNTPTDTPTNTPFPSFTPTVTTAPSKINCGGCFEKTKGSYKKFCQTIMADGKPSEYNWFADCTPTGCHGVCESTCNTGILYSTRSCKNICDDGIVTKTWDQMCNAALPSGTKTIGEACASKGGVDSGYGATCKVGGKLGWQKYYHCKNDSSVTTNTPCYENSVSVTVLVNSLPVTSK